MKNIIIFQIKADAPERLYKLFEPYKRVTSRFGKIDFSDYKSVFCGDIPKESTLNDIYEIFNLYHPAGYKGHSLSVSDLIMTDGKIYYVDSYGFREIVFKGEDKEV